MNIKVEVADITKQKVDAIVNAANESCLGGGGVDGAIHRAAGPGLLQECMKLPQTRTGVRCPTGEARITGAGNLPCRFVIHTVGPDCSDVADKSEQDRLLASAYVASLRLAKENGVKTMAFPSISTGIFGFPIERAAKIVAKTVGDFLANEPDMSVTMCIFDRNKATEKKLVDAYTQAFADNDDEPKCCCDMCFFPFEEIKERIKTASVAELLAIRKKALAKARAIEKDLLACENGCQTCWVEDEGIVYDYQMQFVSACSLRLAQKYRELMEDEQAV